MTPKDAAARTAVVGKAPTGAPDSAACAYAASVTPNADSNAPSLSSSRL